MADDYSQMSSDALLARLAEINGQKDALLGEAATVTAAYEDALRREAAERAEAEAKAAEAATLAPAGVESAEAAGPAQ